MAGMDEPAVPAPPSGRPSSYVLGQNVDDRNRLQNQFGLLREDFLAWFGEALRRAGLPGEPERAACSVLDVGCGEGQYAQEIARQYPPAPAAVCCAARDGCATMAS
jgi:SAM-dependent methyltransferase